MRTLTSLALSLFLAACASGPQNAPTAPPPSVPQPPPARPVPPPQAVPTNWGDAWASNGDWVYRQDDRGSIALFGEAGKDAEFMLRCDKDRRRIFMSRRIFMDNGQTLAMEIRTSAALKRFSLRPTGSKPPYVAVELDPREPHLDAMAFSRGKFLVSMEGAPNLIVPNWAEVGRVVEDCRG